MKTEIDNYRGYEIRFDTDNESFECDIDDSRSVKKSYASVKKFIDDYIKDNSEFKPFKVVKNPKSMFGGKSAKIVGIRKDGRFMAELCDGSKFQIANHEMDSFMLLNSENDSIIQSIYTSRIEIETIQKRIKALEGNLIIKTLKDIHAQYKQL